MASKPNSDTSPDSKGPDGEGGGFIDETADTDELSYGDTVYSLQPLNSPSAPPSYSVPPSYAAGPPSLKTNPDQSQSWPPLPSDAEQLFDSDAGTRFSQAGDTTPPSDPGLRGFESADHGLLRPRHSKLPTQRSPLGKELSVHHADRSDPLLGRCLADKYTLTAKLGQGAMGQVYRGVHETLGTPIAVKVMRRSVASDSVYRRRFAREARAASLLNHPNVVRVLDYGEEGDMPYIVMEFIDGHDLDSWLDNLGTLPSLELVGKLSDQILSALQVAHERGVVHRDLKPENVMMARLGASGDWLAKVSDFGLAHVDDPRDNQPTLTQKDAVAGTPAYMSPEQCRSLAVGPSTDLYAFGCLLTVLLQGTPPFPGTTPIDVISKQMFAEPPALERPEGLEPIPPLLEQLRLELLAKKPHKRPISAQETQLRLARALNPEQNLREVPNRKGEVPIGSRGDRSSSIPFSTTPQIIDDLSEETQVALIVLPQASGINDAFRIGLAAQAIRLQDQSLDGAQAILLDAGDAPSAVSWLNANRLKQPVMVALKKVSTQDINALIASGAREVITYPLEPGPFARRVRRSVRQRQRA